MVYLSQLQTANLALDLANEVVPFVEGKNIPSQQKTAPCTPDQAYSSYSIPTDHRQTNQADEVKGSANKIISMVGQMKIEDALPQPQVAAAHGRRRAAVMRTFEAASATGGAGSVVGRPHLVCDSTAQR